MGMELPAEVIAIAPGHRTCGILVTMANSAKVAEGFGTLANGLFKAGFLRPSEHIAKGAASGTENGKVFAK